MKKFILITLISVSCEVPQKHLVQPINESEKEEIAVFPDKVYLTPKGDTIAYKYREPGKEVIISKQGYVNSY